MLFLAASSGLARPAESRRLMIGRRASPPTPGGDCGTLRVGGWAGSSPVEGCTDEPLSCDRAGSATAAKVRPAAARRTICLRINADMRDLLPVSRFLPNAL